MQDRLSRAYADPIKFLPADAAGFFYGKIVPRFAYNIGMKRTISGRNRILLACCAVVAALAFTVGMCVYALAQTAAGVQKLTIVIDAGHGGVDGGVVGTRTNVKESDINLSVSRLLQTEFEAAGFHVVQTRPTEAGLYGSATKGYKKRDMQRRAEIIEENAPAAVISVHQNFFPVSSRRGAQVFFRETNELSRTLACSVQTALNEMPECVVRSEALKGDYYVLNCNDYASVIVECGFLSNAADEALLVTERYQKRLAEAICQGTVAFLAAGTAS